MFWGRGQGEEQGNSCEITVVACACHADCCMRCRFQKHTMRGGAKRSVDELGVHTLHTCIGFPSPGREFFRSNLYAVAPACSNRRAASSVACSEVNWYNGMATCSAVMARTNFVHRAMPGASTGPRGVMTTPCPPPPFLHNCSPLLPPLC